MFFHFEGVCIYKWHVCSGSYEFDPRDPGPRVGPRDPRVGPRDLGPLGPQGPGPAGEPGGGKLLKNLGFLCVFWKNVTGTQVLQGFFEKDCFFIGFIRFFGVE